MSEEEELDFEREYGVPVHAGGSLVIARWGMGLAMLFVAIAFSALLLSYFYLRIDNDEWPPLGAELPPLGPGIVAAALVVASAVVMRGGVRRIGRGDVAGLRVSLVAAVVLAVAAIVIQSRALLDSELGWTEHAYMSITALIAGFVAVALVGACVMAALVLYWSTRGYYSARRHTVPTNVSLFWLGMSAVWLVGSATILLGPRLT